MGVVDVVAGAVGEHRVDQVGLDLGRQQRRRRLKPAGVVAGVLVLEVPADLAIVDGEVGVDQQRRGRDRVAVGAAHHDAVLGLDAADLWDRHVSTLTNEATGSHENGAVVAERQHLASDEPVVDDRDTSAPLCSMAYTSTGRHTVRASPARSLNASCR